ncbi:immunoglobulin lambda-1 light chain-like isoform X4 [Dermochelys coriacea]|uniref:immunoglobulin lambda-1 light chain-like isoform X4 n=1 Tax=Dermochelys coriacea TaxID=27794 RepID=UPI001CA805E4|nr:immunoglobulin lambda-1 light chain-like isoform X4 [Dermochelys coriacea]
MLWVPLIVLLGTWCTGSSSQPVVTQPPSVSVSPGNTVKLSCTMSSGTSISGYTVSWYQQKPGNSPRYLLYYYSESSKGQGSGVPARFSGSKDTASNAGYLTISGALAEDEADYYFAVWTGISGSAWIFGGGTQLTVLGQPKASPTMHLFPPSSEEIKTKSKATLVCLLGSFYPGSVQVTWKADGQPLSTGVETTKPSKQSDNKFMASSYLSLDASKWKTHDTYTCQVTHDGKNFEKSLKSSDCS